MKSITIPYTKKKLQELEAWFDNHRPYPKSLRLDASTFIPDVEHTMACLRSQANIYYENRKMQGPIRLMERIKKKLEEEGGEEA